MRPPRHHFDPPEDAESPAAAHAPGESPEQALARLKERGRCLYIVRRIVGQRLRLPALLEALEAEINSGEPE